jgi:heptosyltransferase-1
LHHRILIVRLSHLGDVVHALPVYHALRHAYPEAELAWAVQSEFAGVLSSLPGLARTFLFGRRQGLSAWSRLRRDFAEWQPDWAVDAQGNTKSAMVTLTSGAARRSGLARADWRERFASHTSTDRAPAARGPHAVERMISLARHVAPDIDADSIRFDLPLTDTARERGRALLAEHAAGAPPDWIVHLSALPDVRAWPAGHFAELVRELQAAGRSVLVLSGPEEAEIGRNLAAELDLPGVSHWVEQRGLEDLAVAFAAAASRGSRLLACDSGPAHLAAAVGLEVSLLAGPQDPERTGPWPYRLGTKHLQHAALLNPAPPECAPCLARRCSHAHGPVCMTGLGPAHVASILLNVAPPPHQLSSPPPSDAARATPH